MHPRLSMFLLATVAGAYACGGVIARTEEDGAAGVGGQSVSNGTAGWSGMPMGGTGGRTEIGWGGGLPSGSGGESPVDPPPDPWDEWLAKNSFEGPYEDERPNAPAESVPPVPPGTPGWRQSRTPLCSSLTDIVDADIWADETGVAVLAHAPRCNSGEDDPCGPFGSELWYNDGTGWEWLWGTTARGILLAGIPSGDLLLGGPPGVLALRRDGTPSSLRTPVDAGAARGLFSARTATAYALLRGDTSPEEPAHLYRSNGDNWTPLGTLAGSVRHEILYDAKLAAAGESVYLLASYALYRAQLGGDFESMTDVPEGRFDAFTAAAEDHIWIANSSRQILHYDGETWEVIGGFSPPLRGFWNDGNVAYFVSEHQFGRATADSVDLIVQDSSFWFHSITGISSKEVFVTMRDATLAEYACDTLLIAVYDGEQFHRF